MTKAIFFDRDGVINKLIARDGGYYSPRSFKKFFVFNNAKHVISTLKEKGYLSIVISNQPDIARGYLKKSELDKMTKVLLNKLMVDDVFYCTHAAADNCICRKPAPGLLNQAAEKWKIDLQQSYMVGDTWKDAKAAINVKVDFILLNRDYNLDYQCSKRINNLKDIFKFIRG